MMESPVSESELYRIPVMGQADDAELAARLREFWETPPGLRGWLSTVDHKIIGIRYLITAFAFLLLGGIEALVMRVQLAHANQHVLTPEQYNQLFTMHGITMIFLYALPVLSGFSNYLWPLLLGSRDMAFPRLNALSFWIFLFSGLFIYMSFLMGPGPNAGWFNYVPFASLSYNPGQGIDIYAIGMIMLGVSTTVGSINFIVTLFRTRAPGMSINRLPILVWGTLTASVANLLAVPAVSLAFLMLWMDRQFGTHFYAATEGGSPLLWQHLFWMFGHPWVYAIVLPAMGIISDGLPTFCRRPLVGYTLVALSTVATMFLGFGVWVHHMFATGMPALSLSFFSVASFVIAIPSSVAVFAWIATIWTGKPVFTTPFLFFASFVLLFVVGGVSGFMTAAVPLDLQLTDTYFIVAHLHYVLLGINVFPVIGGIYYWFPKMTGRLMGERLGRWNFWIMFIGFNMAFFPMHISGLLGMPRRVYTYPSGYGWDTLNYVTSIGAFLFAFGVLLFLINFLRSLRHGKPAGDNPWDAFTLEWATTSPPPPYNFAVIPTVASRHPLWEDRLDEAGVGRTVLDHGPLLDQGRETMGTTSLDADPDVILKMPEDSYTPLISALLLALLCYCALMHWWWLGVYSVILIFIIIVIWLWPRTELGQTVSANKTNQHD
jgi:cytochrome c oxidase subunit I